MYHSSEGRKGLINVSLNLLLTKIDLEQKFMLPNVLATQSNMLELNVRKFSFGLISGKKTWLERTLCPSIQMLLYLL